MKLQIPLIGESEITIQHLLTFVAYFIFIIAISILAIVDLKIFSTISGLVGVLTPLIIVAIFYAISKKKDLKDSVGLSLFYFVLMFVITLLSTIYLNIFAPSNIPKITPIIALLGTIKGSVVFAFTLAGIFAAFNEKNRQYALYGAIILLAVSYVRTNIVPPIIEGQNLYNLFVLPDLITSISILIFGFSLTALISEFNTRKLHQNKYVIIFAVPLFLSVLSAMISMLANPDSLMDGLANIVTYLGFSAILSLIL